MSDSVQPHRRQPIRLPRPWDSPGKNTGVGCHFLLQRMKVKSESEVAQSCPTLSDPLDCILPGSSVHGISRQEYWSGCHCLLRYLLYSSLIHRRKWVLGLQEIFINVFECMNSKKAMAPHSSTLAWKIPWMEEPGRLQSIGSLRVGHD